MSDLQKQMIEFSTMDLVSAVAASRKLSPTEAMAVVYKSSFFKKLQDPETGLYRESKAYLLRRFQADFAAIGACAASWRRSCASRAGSSGTGIQIPKRVASAVTTASMR